MYSNCWVIAGNNLLRNTNIIYCPTIAYYNNTLSTIFKYTTFIIAYNFIFITSARMSRVTLQLFNISYSSVTHLIFGGFKRGDRILCALNKQYHEFICSE